MADIVSTPTTSADAATPNKKSAKKGAKAARPKASHPPTAIMVTNAIKHLKERGGSSLQAIKKYIASTYKIDAEKLAPFIKKYIKASVINGELIQTKGKGASGSFKLATIAIAKAPSTKAAKAKKPAAKKVKAKPKVEKPVVAKKTPVKAARKAPVERKTPVKKTKAAKAKKPVAVKTPVKKASPKAKTTKAKSPAKTTKKTASKKK